MSRDAAPGPGSTLRPSELEIAAGELLGDDAAPASLPDPGARPYPARVLEQIVLPALETPPCLVAFSGGRDSSTVLAAAARAARREGLPDPVPVTIRVCDAPAMDESAWQERVVAHLRLGDWERIEAGDELDLVGAVSRRLLTRHGLLFPPTMNVFALALERTSAGPLVTGFGGDSVFGAWRLGGLRDGLAGRVPRRRALLAAAYAAAPRRARRELLRRRGPRHPWLRPGAHRAVTDASAESEAREPVRWDRQLAWRLGLRRMVAAEATASTIAAEYGRPLASPLLDPRFVGALARAGGRLGLGGRTSVMRALFAGLLPDDVLSREDKARPVGVFFRGPTREFAAGWPGGGVDPALADPAILREVWSGASPDPHSALALQSAWLATAGGAGYL